MIETSQCINNGTIDVNGLLLLAITDLCNNGTITVKENVFFNVNMSTLDNNGYFTVNLNGSLNINFGGRFVNKHSLVNYGTINLGIEGGRLETVLTAVTTNQGRIIIYGFLEGAVINEGSGYIENHVAMPINEGQFLNALADNNIARIYIDGGTEITLNTDATFTKKVEIDGGILNIAANVNINGSDGYLAVDGDGEDIYGQVNVAPGKTVATDGAGRISISGELYVQGSFTNNGVLIVDECGDLLAEEADTCTNTGTLIVNGFLTLGATDLNNSGDISVNPDGGMGVYMSTLTNSGDFTVFENGMLEVDRGGWFVNQNTLTNDGTVTVTNDGANLENDNGATITNNGIFYIYGYFTDNGTWVGTAPIRN